MYTQKNLIAGIIVTLLIFGANSEPSAEEAIARFDFRGSQEINLEPLEQQISNAARWGLRNTRAEILNGSLLYGSIDVPHAQGSLFGYFRKSINRSSLLRSTIHQANASQFAARAQLYRLLPTLSFTAEIASQGRVSPVAPLRSSTDTQQATITANWTIFSSGANWSAIRAANWDAKVADLNFLVAERQVFFENALIYLELLASHKLLAAVSNTHKRLKKIRYGVKQKYHAGIASRTDIAKIDSEIASVEAQRSSARSSFNQQRIAYKDVVGSDAPKRLKEPKTSHLVSSSKKETLSRALYRNTSIAAAYANKNAATARSNFVRGQYLPKVSLFASGTTNEFDYKRASNDYDWQVGARLTIPLVDFTAMPRYRESRQLALSAGFQAQDTQRSIQREIERAWTAHQAFKKQKTILMRKSKAIKRALVGITKEIDAGLRPIDDLLREEIALIENRVSIVQIELNISSTAYQIAAQFSETQLNEIAPI